jgi:hypothetical protein
LQSNGNARCGQADNQDILSYLLTGWESRCPVGGRCTGAARACHCQSMNHPGQ